MHNFAGESWCGIYILLYFFMEKCILYIYSYFLNNMIAPKNRLDKLICDKHKFPLNYFNIF